MPRNLPVIPLPAGEGALQKKRGEPMPHRFSALLKILRRASCQNRPMASASVMAKYSYRMVPVWSPQVVSI